jgi:hypothetical protein
VILENDRRPLLVQSRRWTSADHVLVSAKVRANRLSFAVLLFFREHGRYPLGSSEIDRPIAGEVAQQIHVPASADHALNLSGRTAERHRAEIRTLSSPISKPKYARPFVPMIPACRPAVWSGSARNATAGSL